MTTRACLIVSFSLVALSIVASSGFAQEPVAAEVVARIKEEAFQRSQVLDTLSYLTDVYGPRLSGTPAYDDAAKDDSRPLGAITDLEGAPGRTRAPIETALAPFAKTRRSP